MSARATAAATAAAASPQWSNLFYIAKTSSALALNEQIKFTLGARYDRTGTRRSDYTSALIIKVEEAVPAVIVSAFARVYGSQWSKTWLSAVSIEPYEFSRTQLLVQYTATRAPPMF